MSTFFGLLSTSRSDQAKLIHPKSSRLQMIAECEKFSIKKKIGITKVESNSKSSRRSILNNPTEVMKQINSEQ